MASPSPFLENLRGDLKAKIIDQYKQEQATANARQLIDKINEHCFERCVPKPGTSLSKGEQTCLTACMEKYMSAWNTVSRQYVHRLQDEQRKSGGGLIGGL